MVGRPDEIEVFALGGGLKRHPKVRLTSLI